MNNFDDLLSDDQLASLATGEDPTVNIKIPLRETQPIKEALAGKKKEIIGRIKKQRTQQLSALNDEGPTSPIIRTDQVSPSGLSIHDIYKNAGLGTEKDEGFNVFRVESMLDDTSIIELDDRAKEAAVVMALKTHDVQMDEVIDDGRDHQLALEAHDLRFQDELKTLSDKLETENARLHAEIERYANPRIARMESNQKELDELQVRYDAWLEQKRDETVRLDRMLNRWTSGGSHVTAPMAIAEKKSKRETAPLPLFEEESEEDNFLAPVVLTSSELDSEVIRLANAFPEEESILEESSAVFEEDRAELSRSEEIDLTLVTANSSKNAMSIAYYLWAVLAVFLWIFGGITVATIADTMQPIAALGLAFGIPLGVALTMRLFSKGHGRWLGFVAFLGYFGLVMSVVVHFDADNLAKLLSQNPVWLTEVSDLDGTKVALPDALSSGLTSLSNRYAEFLYSSGLATKP